jgi:hypothetical protein
VCGCVGVENSPKHPWYKTTFAHTTACFSPALSLSTLSYSLSTLSYSLSTLSYSPLYSLLLSSLTLLAVCCSNQGSSPNGRATLKHKASLPRVCRCIGVSVCLHPKTSECHVLVRCRRTREVGFVSFFFCAHPTNTLSYPILTAHTQTTVSMRSSRTRPSSPLPRSSQRIW